MTNPRLAFVAGPLKDSAVELGDAEVSIGRDSTNTIRVADSLLSRRHCVARPEGAGFRLFDLDSLNGTFVNGLPVREHPLEHGDEITVGESRIVFLASDTEAPASASNPVELSERQMNARSTVRMKVSEALAPPEADGGAGQPPASLARDLTLLVKVSTAINSVRGTEALQRELLRFVFEVVPAERGAILLLGDGGEVVSEFAQEREGARGEAMKVSRTVVRQVVEEGEALLGNDLFEGTGSLSTESIRAAHISSLLCAPLVLFGRTLGVIYLTAVDPSTHFDEDHLRLVSVISGLAAVSINNARHVEQVEGENDLLRAASRVEHGMVGESAAMRKVYRLVARVAPTDSTVLIRGESGTGKELAAQKKGKLEVADGGTLFLDEVGELAPVLQAKLLRVLQERSFERVGGTRTIRVDVRVVAATNRDLEDAVKSGTFRQDLYYRLNVVSFEMPALRERREDVALLATHFAAKYGAKFKRKVTGVSAEARECLVNYDWPGNVRELENAIERAVVLGSTSSILPEDLPETVLEAEPAAGQDAPPVTKYHEAVREAKRQLIARALEQSSGGITEAARALGVHPNYLHRLMRNLNLRPEAKK